jgi:hypothetical protein
VISIYYGSINEAQKLFTKPNLDDGDNPEKVQEDKETEGKFSVIKFVGGSDPQLPRILLSKVSPPLYINSRKLSKEPQ